MKKMKKTGKRFLCFAMSLALLTGNINVPAYAKESNQSEDTVIEDSIDECTVSDNKVDGYGYDVLDLISLDKTGLPTSGTVDTVTSNGEASSLTWSIDEAGILTVKGSGRPKLQTGFINECYEGTDNEGDYKLFMLNVGVENTWPWAKYYMGITGAEIYLTDYDSAENMFRDCYFLDKVTFYSSTESVKSMKAMFKNCYSLESVNTKDFDTSNVTDMSSMFEECWFLEKLNLSSFDTRNVTDMSHMFQMVDEKLSNGYLKNDYSPIVYLKDIDLSSFDTRNVTDMSYMFAYNEYLKDVTINKERFSTLNVTNMSRLFCGCFNIDTLDFSGLNTGNVKDMSGMFMGCKNLDELNLSGFDTSNVTNMSGMFWECGETALDVSGFDTRKVTDMSNMFGFCNSKTLDVSGFDTSKVTDMSGMFSGCKFETLDVSGFDTSNVTDMSNMFGDYEESTEITELDLSGFNTTKVTDMSGMFRECTAKILDVSKFDTSNVTSMSGMFSYCRNITELDVSGFDTSNVTNMYSMFCCCKNITELDVSGFDTSNVRSMGEMFSYCKNITELDVSGFDTSNVRSMSDMFSYCENITELDVSGFDTSNVEFMSSMFEDCKKIEKLDLGNFDTGSVKGFSYMFYNCISLSELNVSGFDTTNAEEYDDEDPFYAMFYMEESSLKVLDLSSFTINFPVYNMFGKNQYIDTIVAPKNVEVDIPLPGDNWYDSNGSKVTKLPQNTKTPVILQRGKKADVYKPYTVTVKVAANGKVNPTTCSFDPHFPRTFYIVPNKGYAVKSVLIDGVDMGPITSYTFDTETMGEKDHTLEVSFAPAYKLTVKKCEHGKVTGDLVAQKGEKLSFNIEADDGWCVSDVILNGKSIGAVESYTIDEVDKDYTLKVEFEEAFKISASCGEHGKITPEGVTRVKTGKSQNYTITPDEDYVVDSLLVDGKKVESQNSYTFSDVKENHTISVTFKKATFVVTFDANGGETATKTKKVTIGKAYGELPNATINGMIFAGWFTDKTEGTKVTAETVFEGNSDITLYAHYEMKSLAVKQKYNVSDFFTGVEGIKKYKVVSVDTGKATVNKKGILTAKKAGKIMVIPCIKDGKKTKALEDKAISLEITKPEFNTKKIEINANDTVNAKEKLMNLPKNSNEVTFVMQKKKSPAATVDANTGVVTGVKKGKIKLTAVIKNDKGYESKVSVTIKVNQ